MAETVSVHVPLVEVRKSGGKWEGFITSPWFRYLVNSSPDGFGTGTGVLHGNPSGPGTWGPVDLATDVTGQLPVANGGLGGITATIGGLLYFATATTVASSAALAANQVVVGGGSGAPSTVAAGFAHQVLHFNPLGAPFWQTVNLTTDVNSILPIANGGTGASAGTGTGAPVFSNAPVINNPNLSGGTWTGGTWTQPTMGAQVLFNSFASAVSQIGLNDSVTVTVNVGPTNLCIENLPMVWACYDHTLGGMAFGVSDPTGGVNVIYNGLTNVTFGYSGGITATVTGAPTTRTFRMALISLGHA